MLLLQGVTSSKELTHMHKDTHFEHDGGSERRLRVSLPHSGSQLVSSSLALLLPHSAFLLTKQFCQLAAALLLRIVEGGGRQRGREHANSSVLYGS